METNEINNLLFKKCNLNKKEDLFTQKFKTDSFTFIKKSGIEKIISFLEIQVNIESFNSIKDHASVLVKAEYDGIIVQDLGSANSLNSPNNKYYAEMALKRAISRAVLKVTKLSMYGFKGEEDFVLPNKLSSEEITNKLEKLFE